jgi:hypothetical protein
MRDAPAYVHHAIDGRLRIKIPSIKGSSAKAADLERQLRCLAEGIEHVTANPTTGSVLITYDPRQVGQRDIFEGLARLGCRPRSHRDLHSKSDKGAPILAQGFGRDLARTVLHSTMEFALQRLIYALI